MGLRAEICLAVGPEMWLTWFATPLWFWVQGTCLVTFCFRHTNLLLEVAVHLLWSLCIFNPEWNDAKAETPVLWPPHAKSWLIGKDSEAGRDWGQEEKGKTEDEMAGWHHRLNGRESEWTLGDGDGQGGLACCDSWGCKESDTTERLNWTEWIQNLP